MNAWWKKALAVSAIWAAFSVGGGAWLASSAPSQFAADKITVWIAPALAVGLVVIWIAALALRKRR